MAEAEERWFEYIVRSQPHDTDYGGVVWHGTYIRWMETARVECLRSVGANFADWVALGCDLPVVDLSLRYHQPVRFGMEVVVKTRLHVPKGVRQHWDYRIESLDGQQTYVTGRVTLVAVDPAKGKVLRRLPPVVTEAIAQLTRQTSQSGFVDFQG